MHGITGGMVRYEKRSKIGAGPEHKQASAEIWFNVPDGHDWQSYLDQAAAAAFRYVQGRMPKRPVGRPRKV